MIYLHYNINCRKHSLTIKICYFPLLKTGGVTKQPSPSDLSRTFSTINYVKLPNNLTFRAVSFSIS